MRVATKLQQMLPAVVKRLKRKRKKKWKKRRKKLQLLAGGLTDVKIRTIGYSCIS